MPQMSKLPIFSAFVCLVAMASGCAGVWGLTESESSEVFEGMDLPRRAVGVCKSVDPADILWCAMTARRQTLEAPPRDAKALTRLGYVAQLHAFTCKRGAARRTCWRLRRDVQPRRSRLELGPTGARWSMGGSQTEGAPAAHRLFRLGPAMIPKPLRGAWLLLARSQRGYVLGLFTKEVESPTLTR